SRRQGAPCTPLVRDKEVLGDTPKPPAGRPLHLLCGIVGFPHANLLYSARRGLERSDLASPTNGRSSSGRSPYLAGRYFGVCWPVEAQACRAERVVACRLVFAPGVTRRARTPG